MTPKAFYNQYAKYAAGSAKYKIFPIVTLAVAYLESNRPGSGVSVLAAKYNNFHGIQVYPKWRGKTIRLLDNQAGNYRTFCVYPSVQAGFDGFAQFLVANPRYGKAGVFNAKSPREQINRIGYAGYSEVKSWNVAVNKLLEAGGQIKTIASNNSSVLMGLTFVALLLVYLNRNAIFAGRND